MSAHELGSDELLLQGRLQVTVARDALAATGVNPEAAEHLSIILDAHEDLTSDGAQKDLLIFLGGGGQTERMKSDIVMGLELAVQDENVARDARTAAQGLLELLTGPKEDLT